MKRNKSPFKWRHFEPTIILLCVRCYCRYSLSLEGVESMHILRKGQVKRLDGMDAVGRAKFVESLFGVAA